jgi:protein tyrosine kinase modulator
MDSLRPRNLADYFRAIRRHKLAIIAPTVVVLVASYVAIKGLPNIYESSTFIIVESPQGERSEASSDLSRRLTTIRQQVTSRTRLEEIITKYDLYSDSLSKGVRIDDVISHFRSDVVVDVNSSREQSTDAFTITYRATDPETAQKVTEELANELIADNVKAMESAASGEADVLRQRAAQISAQLHDLEEKGPWLLTLKEDTPIMPQMGNGGGQSAQRAADMRLQQMSIENLKDQQYKLQQQIADLEKRINLQRQIVEQQKKNTPLRDNPVYAALVAKRAELQGQRDNLINRQELTDKHPRVIAINDQMAALERQMAEIRQQEAGNISQSLEARDLASLESERNRLRTELEVTARAIDRQIANPPLPAVASGPVTTVTPAQRDAGSARLAQDYLGLKQTYKEVLSKLQDAELKRQTIGSAKVEQFRVLDQANLPQLPVWPNRRLMAVCALAAGLAVGAAFAFLIELRRFTSLQDARDVEYYTRLPLLVAIPKTETPEEQKRTERRAKLRLLLATAVAVVATFALTKLLIFANLFALIGKK